MSSILRFNTFFAIRIAFLFAVYIEKTTFLTLPRSGVSSEISFVRRSFAISTETIKQVANLFDFTRGDPSKESFVGSFRSFDQSDNFPNPDEMDESKLSSRKIVAKEKGNGLSLERRKSMFLSGKINLPEINDLRVRTAKTVRVLHGSPNVPLY
jgi:hypothetical protein